MSGTVFITGAGRRIGRALALGFAERGWSIAIHYGESREGAEQTAGEVREKGAEAFVVQADVRDRAGIRDAIFSARDRFGRLDALVNNAGIYPPPRSIADTDEDLWREVIETNLYGEFFAAQAAAEAMLAQEPVGGISGRIVNFSSLGAFQIWKDRIPYNVSKAAVVQLTRALARSVAPSIMVNSVAPGAIHIPDDPAKGSMIQEYRIPMRRYGTTDDIFTAVWFLAAEASYMTGQTLIVDGGLGIAQETSQE